MNVKKHFFVFYQDCYPERLDKLYFVRAPYIFMTAWKVIYPFVDTNTRKKVNIFCSSTATPSLIVYLVSVYCFETLIVTFFVFSWADCFRGEQETDSHSAWRHRRSSTSRHLRWQNASYSYSGFPLMNGVTYYSSSKLLSPNYFSYILYILNKTTKKTIANILYCEKQEAKFIIFENWSFLPFDIYLVS